MRFCNMEFGCSCIILMDVASVQVRPDMRHLSQVLKSLKIGFLAQSFPRL